MKYRKVVIRNREGLDWLDGALRRIKRENGIVALDTETTGVNPGVESPCGRGGVAGWSLAFREAGTDTLVGVFLPGPRWPVEHSRALSELGKQSFRQLSWWLEDPLARKTGHNIFSFDRHVIANDGVILRGVARDTMRMSKIRPKTSKFDSHKLEHLAIQRCGATPRPGYKECFRRRKENKPLTIELKTKKDIKDGFKTSKRKCGPFDKVPTYSFPGTYPTISHAGIARGKPQDAFITLDIADWIILKGHLYLDVLIDYAVEDAVETLLLQESFDEEFSKIKTHRGFSLLEFYKSYWNPALYSINRAERNGVLLDQKKLAAIREVAEEDLHRYEKTIQELAPEIPKVTTTEINNYIHDVLRLPVSPVKGTKHAVEGNYDKKRTSAEAALIWYGTNWPEYAEIFKALRDWRKTTTLMNNFILKLPNWTDERGRIHSVMAPETITGRLTSKLPNMQQVPKNNDKYGLRSVFVVPEGYVWGSFDYSQLELFLLAHILIRKFDDHSLAHDLESGDVHTATARRCWPHVTDPEELQLKRKFAKVVNYKVNYGGSVTGLAVQLEMTNAEAQAILDAYFEAYPGIPEYREWIQRFGAQQGWVPTMAGRRVHVRRDQPRAMLNYPLQGGAADIVMIAMTNCDKLLTPRGVRFILQVHDELNFEIPENMQSWAAQKAIKTMEEAWPDLEINLRVDGDLGRTWAGGGSTPISTAAPSPLRMSI